MQQCKCHRPWPIVPPEHYIKQRLGLTNLIRTLPRDDHTRRLSDRPTRHLPYRKGHRSAQGPARLGTACADGVHPSGADPTRRRDVRRACDARLRFWSSAPCWLPHTISRDAQNDVLGPWHSPLMESMSSRKCVQRHLKVQRYPVPSSKRGTLNVRPWAEPTHGVYARGGARCDIPESGPAAPDSLFTEPASSTRREILVTRSPVPASKNVETRE